MSFDNSNTMVQIMIIVASLHIILCPFTKVEESFNMQAFHDILYYRHNLSMYDHHEFSGVVPRTFIGPLVISILTAPVTFMFQSMQVSKLYTQYIVRVALAVCVVCAWGRLRASLQRHYGHVFAWFYTAATLVQFHFMFYMGRALPNIMTLPLVLLAYEAWLDNKYQKFLLASGAAIIWFRAELAMLFGLFLLYDLLYKRVKLISVIKLVAPMALMLISVTVIVDSVFWGRLVWPEAEVFYFNTILNKSSQWGTSPFLWYFYSGLPRSLGPSLALVPLGLYVDRRLWTFALPALIYVTLFSFLPHKELRFIVYVLPLLTAVVAGACSYVYNRREKSLVYKALFAGVVVILAGNIAFTGFLLAVASANYPGGVAITRFHRYMRDESNIHLHIGNLAAQTGVTRFTEENSNWKYSKNESLDPSQLQEFTHLLVEAKSKYSPNLKPFAKTHRVIDIVDAFQTIAISYKTFPPLKLKNKPAIFVLERKSFRFKPKGKKQKVDEDFDHEEFIYDTNLIGKDVSVETSSERVKINNKEKQSAEATDPIDESVRELQENTKEPESTLTNLENLAEHVDSSQQVLNETIKKDDNLVADTHDNEQKDLEYAQLQLEELKQSRNERKMKAIKKIKSETRREVVESAKNKLKEIMNRRKISAKTQEPIDNVELREEIHYTEEDTQNIKEEIKYTEEDTQHIKGDIMEANIVIKDNLDLKTYMNEPKHEAVDNHLSNDLMIKQEHFDSIVEEVIARLIERKVYDEKTKPEDISNDDRQVIHDIVEEVVAEKMNGTQMTE